MPVSIADVQQAHGYIHGYPVEVGADPLVAALCDGDIRADFARRGTMGKHLLEYTLGDIVRVGRNSPNCVGRKAPIRVG